MVNDRQPGPRTRAEIAALILSKISDGHLPNITISRVWSGIGIGRICDGCDQPISATEIEHEIDLAQTVTLHLHVACFMVWQNALAKRSLEIGGG